MDMPNNHCKNSKWSRMDDLSLPTLLRPLTNGRETHVSRPVWVNLFTEKWWKCHVKTTLQTDIDGQTIPLKPSRTVDRLMVSFEIYHSIWWVFAHQQSRYAPRSLLPRSLDVFSRAQFLTGSQFSPLGLFLIRRIFFVAMIPWRVADVLFFNQFYWFFLGSQDGFPKILEDLWKWLGSLPCRKQLPAPNSKNNISASSKEFPQNNKLLKGVYHFQ